MAGAFSIQFIGDINGVIAIRRNIEIITTIGHAGGLIVVGPDIFAVLRVANNDGRIERRTKRSRENLDAEFLAFLGLEAEPVLVLYFGNDAVERDRSRRGVLDRVCSFGAVVGLFLVEIVERRNVNGIARWGKKVT